MNVKSYIKNYRIILGIIVVFLLVLIPVDKLLRFPTEAGLCRGDFLCESFWLDGVVLPLHSSLIYLVIAVFILIFLSYSFLKIWMKIMIPYFVIALLLVINTKPLCGGMICFDRTIIAGGFAKLFLIFTILIIIGKSIQLFIISKKNKKN